MVIESLPFDKYELEPCPLTQFILSRKQPTLCWQVINIKFKHYNLKLINFYCFNILGFCCKQL